MLSQVVADMQRTFFELIAIRNEGIILRRRSSRRTPLLSHVDPTCISGRISWAMAFSEGYAPRYRIMVDTSS